MRLLHGACPLGTAFQVSSRLRVASRGLLATERWSLTSSPSLTFASLTSLPPIAELKTLNDWPTFPQLIIHGEFVGGLDVVKEMVETGELAEVLAGGAQ